MVIVALCIAHCVRLFAGRRHARKLAVEPAILLMVIAGFYKHSLIATPLATLLWIALGDGPRGLRAALVGVAASAVGLGICTFLYGQAFLQGLMMPRTYSVWTSIGNLGQLQWIAPAAAIWAVWAWHDRQSEAAKFSTIYIATGLFAYLLQKLGASIGVNAHFELTAAMAIGLACALSRADSLAIAYRWPTDRVLTVCVLILIIRLVASSRIESYLVLTSAKYRQEFTQSSAVVTQEIARVRGMPGLIHCSVMTVCFRAGKSFVLHDFAIEQRLKKGLMTRAELLARLEADKIRIVEIDPRASAQSLQWRL